MLFLDAFIYILYYIYFSIQFYLKLRKIYKSGIWTCDLQIDVPALYQLS